MASTKCPVCGSDNNQEGDVFCGDCGNRLAQSSPADYAARAKVELPTAPLSDRSQPIREPPAPIRRAGVTSGFVVFSLGIALLVATFVVALLAFLNPDQLEDFGKLIPAPEGDWQGAVKALGYAVAVALLVVIGIIAGRIAALGIKMFKARPSSE